MAMTTADTILGKARGAPLNIAGASRHVDLVAYMRESFRLAPLIGLDPAISVSQSAHETANWTSGWWEQRLNPAGIGITGDPVENLASHTWANGTDAAQAHLAHLLVYVLGPNEAGSVWARKATGAAQPLSAVDVRYEAYLEAYGNVAIAETVKDLSGTWAVDLLYAEGIVARSRTLWPDLPDQDQGATPVAEHTTTIPGLPGGPLKTTYPITVNLISSSNTRQRSGLTAHTPRRSVQHGTGNPNNPDAAAEAQWFVNGADGGTASVHYCTDDTKAVVVLPLNEVSWQAADGAGPGNMNGFSCEMMEASAIWQDFGRRDRLIALTADLMGRTAARLGVASPERHWDFNAGTADRHHCPNMLMSTGLWETSYVPKWQAARADELKRMRGDTPEAPDVDYPPKRVPAPDVMKAQGFALAFTKPSRFKCLQGGYFKTYPNRDAPNGTSTPYKAGRVYTLGFSTVVDGEPWLVSAAGSWTPAKNFEGVT